MSTYRCPDWPQPGISSENDIIGCGREFNSDWSPDDDRYDEMVDCPHCGIFFLPEQGLGGAMTPTYEPCTGSASVLVDLALDAAVEAVIAQPPGSTEREAARQTAVAILAAVLSAESDSAVWVLARALDNCLDRFNPGV